MNFIKLNIRTSLQAKGHLFRNLDVSNLDQNIEKYRINFSY